MERDEYNPLVNTFCHICIDCNFATAGCYFNLVACAIPSSFASAVLISTKASGVLETRPLERRLMVAVWYCKDAARGEDQRIFGIGLFGSRDVLHSKKPLAPGEGMGVQDGGAGMFVLGHGH